MEIPFEAAVSSVVVFPDRARVTCRGAGDLPEGQHQIIIGELPLSLEPDSLRAAGSGTARVRLRSVDVQRRHYAQTPAADVLELEKQLEKVQAALHALDDREAVKQASIDHLDGLREATKEYAWGLARGRQTTENQAGLMRFFEEEDTRLRADLRELEEEQRALKDEMTRLQAELDQIRSARPRQRYEARLEVEVLSAGAFEAEIAYIVGRAGWRPLYDMRLLAEQGNGTPNVSITSLAEITQNTGQAWTDVRLSVSTARPALNQRVPEIKPWYVDAFQPQPRMMKAHMAARDSGEMTMAFAEEAAPLMAMADRMPVAAEVEQAELQETGTAVTFLVSGGVDIPGDGTPKKTTLGAHDMPPQLDFLAVPRHTDAVYRRARVTNASGAPMLEGPVNLYVGDEYIGQNRLEYTPNGGEMELVLGVEERIKVKRELKRRETDKRLLRDVRQVLYAYEIELENLLNTAALVTVQDQFPVSRHDQIRVQLDKVAPEPVEKSELHILKWELKLSSGEKQTIRYEYQVEHPRDLRIVGLID